MRIFKHIPHLKGEIRKLKEKGRSVGLVPTMGALHEGHVSLIRHSVKDSDVTVVSIFVNPTQFNDPSDLAKYPRDLKTDLQVLEDILHAEDLVFTPDVKEIYPEKDKRIFDFGHLDKIMEGKYRKGHFNGVAQIVSKLFDIVDPNRAYFGEKDYQQLTIIQKLVEQENLPVEIIPCPIIREKDGLAMSSRNVRLTEKQREAAAFIPETLFRAKTKSGRMDIDELIHWVCDTINSNDLLEVEYFEIVNGSNLLPTRNWSEKGIIIGCIAVHVGNIRLIDNIKFKEI